MFCSLCGQHARHPKSPEPDLRRKACPRFVGGVTRSVGEGKAEPQFGVVHRGCCAAEPCSERDARGHVRCMWERGGRERLALTAPGRAPRGAEASAPTARATRADVRAS